MIKAVECVTSITAAMWPGGTESKASIVGMGGIRKTVLAAMLCHRPTIQAHFWCVVWLTISKDCRYVQDLQKRLLSLMLQGEDERLKHIEDRVKDNGRAMQEELGKLLGERRYLVLLDDVWGSNVLSKLLPRSSLRHNRVVVTTRMHDLLDIELLEVGLLDFEASLARLHASLCSRVCFVTSPASKFGLWADVHKK